MRNQEREVSKYFFVPVREMLRLPGMVRKVAPELLCHFQRIASTLKN
jgi:hypothetical protein